MKTHYDLIVVGGGFAGIGAAISAAKHGADVLLIEKYNCLGGAAANCLIMPFMRYWTYHPETNEKINLCGGFFWEFIEELQAFEGNSAITVYNEESVKLVLNRMAQKYGVQLLFNTTVFEAKAEEGYVRSIRALGKSRVLEFSADTFIDATGDAELSTLAGCEAKVGRDSDGLCQPMTLCFRMSGVDKEKFEANRASINPLYKKFKEKGLIKNPREDVLVFNNFNNGVLHFNTTRIVKKDPTDPFDVTEAEIESREQVYEILKFLKENIEGFEKAMILSTALQIGIRESRKVVGEYLLTQEDLLALARFDDAIATCNYDIDIHNPAGSGTSHHYFANGEWYEIPYRCLIPKGMNNLLVAGRCISSTHEAQASYRIMPYCAELGEAAGVAAAVAHTDGCDVRNADVSKIQEILRDNGSMITRKEK